MLKPLNLNLLSWLVIAIVLLGVVSALTVFMNARTYRDLAFNFQRQHMTQIIASEVAEVLAEQAGMAYRMGQNIQKDTRFRSAFDAGDNELLMRVLETRFGGAAVTSGLIDVVGIYVFDADFELRTVSMRYPGRVPGGALICAGALERVRTGADAGGFGSLDEMCLYDDVAYIASLVPVDTAMPAGYLQVVYDPLSGMRKLDERLGMPVKIFTAQGDSVVESPDWTDGIAANFVQSGYTLATLAGEPALEIVAASNADELILQIDKTNRRLLFIVALVLLVSVGLALLILKYSVFKPLQSLSHQLKSRWIHGSDDSLGALVKGKQLPVSFHALGELYETLRDMAIRDPLTGTYNRALLEDRLSQLIAEHRRNPGVAAVLLIDMVRFKYVNDMLGHHTGDLLLQKVVARIADVLRESDTLARLGGDEFVILLPDTDAAQAEQVAQKIIQSMQREFEVKDHKLLASVSIGIALMPDHGMEVDELLRNADYAMYTAKSSKQGYTAYNPATTEQIAAHRLDPDSMLGKDINRNDLFLVYQPVIEFATGRIHYLEALVRWRLPDGRVLMPDSFIRVAEQSGYIRQLSEWVIDAACRELVALQSIEPSLRSGVNLSMHNLHDFRLLIRIEEALARYGLSANSLMLEITESGVMLDPDQVIEILEKLAALGLKLSIDDFGTGHSSLVHLRRLPVHMLKVDKSFVVDMDTDEENASIVRATIDLAHSLGLTVTAEGVESRSVHDLLKGMRCDYYQGYYVCTPMTLAEIEIWLGKGHKHLQDALR
ncbi:MAG: EAL domain-containing protein [Gammaproteobacteria bacterium]